MSTEVETLPHWKQEHLRMRKNDLEPSGDNSIQNVTFSLVKSSSLPSWKKDLLLRKQIQEHQQHMNGHLLNNNNNVGEEFDRKYNNLPRIKKADSKSNTASYFYPAKDVDILNSTSIQKVDSLENFAVAQRFEWEERILPVHQNPILLMDMERRSRDSAGHYQGSPTFIRNSTDEAYTLPDDVFESQNGASQDNEELAYGQGFVHRLLRKFINLTHQEEQCQTHTDRQKLPSTGVKTTENGRHVIRRSNESYHVHTNATTLSSQGESPEKVLNQQKKSEDKSEEKIEPVSNTLCMFEKLFCSRRSSQDNQEVIKDFKDDESLKKIKDRVTVSSTRDVAQKPFVPQKPTYSGGKIKMSASETSHKVPLKVNVLNIKTIHKESNSSSDDHIAMDGSGVDCAILNSKTAESTHSPVDVKLVTNYFETTNIKSNSLFQPSISLSADHDKKDKILVDKKSELLTKNDATTSSSDSFSTSTITVPPSVAKEDFTSTKDSSAIMKPLPAESQLKQHKRHSSKDYLEIRQQPVNQKVISNVNVVIANNAERFQMSSPSGSNIVKNSKKAEQSKNSSKSLPTSVARPGKLLIRSSTSSSVQTTDVRNLPKYNDIRTGEFVPVSKAFLDDLAAENDECNENFDCEFLGAGVLAGRSLLIKMRDSKKLKIQFDDNTTITHEYPSEQCVIDWQGYMEYDDL